ncbi:MAG: choice-of-anchor Q domain-containing protein [Myxococcota bacterium]|nr:choice-of-anchor Q domain-containing protein [Myxococcota bacterium]
MPRRPRALALLALPLFFAPEPTRAAEFECSTAGFDAALSAAESGDPGPHQLLCEPRQEIVIDEERVVDADLILDGAGGELTGEFGEVVILRLRGAGACDPGACSALVRTRVELSDLTIEGVLRVESGADATVRNVRFRDSHHWGGGPPSRGTASAFGIEEAPPTLRVLDSTVFKTSAGGKGTDVRIERSYLRYLYVGQGAYAEAINSTIDSSILSDGDVLLVNCTVAGIASVKKAYGSREHASCGGARVPRYSGGRLTTVNTIFNGECEIYGGLSCDGEMLAPAVITSLGGNIESFDVSGHPDGTCQLGHPTDQTGAHALLDVQLQRGLGGHNGGTTRSRNLGEDSIAIDAGILAYCPPTDQRGWPRPERGGVACDSGSLEMPEPDSTLGGITALASIVALRNRRATKRFRSKPGARRGEAPVAPHGGLT